MSKFDEKVAKYKKFMDDRNFRSNDDLLKAVTKGLGPSIYKADAETVSGSDPKELATVKNNFLIKKLGLTDDAKLDEGIAEVMDRIGNYGGTIEDVIEFYMIVKKFDKESVYGM